jgi:protein-tyrosine phosphatase
MAEIIMKNKMKDAGVTDFRVTSAGVAAVLGGKMSKNSFEALKSMGYKPYGFKSKPLTDKLVRSADMVICMSASHKAFMKGYDNIYTMNELAMLGDIPDPYGGNKDVYERVAYIISASCEIILSRIINQKGE